MKEFDFDIEKFTNTPEDKLKVSKYSNDLLQMHNILYEGEELEVDEVVDYLVDESTIALLLAKEGENIVGYATLSHACYDRNSSSLENTFVRERYRRRGVYKLLVKERIRISTVLGMDSVYIDPISSAQTTDYLESIGFQYRTEDRNIDNGLKLVLRK